MCRTLWTPCIIKKKQTWLFFNDYLNFVYLNFEFKFKFYSYVSWVLKFILSRKKKRRTGQRLFTNATILRLHLICYANNNITLLSRYKANARVLFSCHYPEFRKIYRFFFNFYLLHFIWKIAQYRFSNHVIIFRSTKALAQIAESRLYSLMSCALMS